MIFQILFTLIIVNITTGYVRRCAPNRIVQAQQPSRSSLLQANINARGSYLERLVDRKKIEVENLLRKHQEPDDPLVMRMGYVSGGCKFRYECTYMNTYLNTACTHFSKSIYVFIHL